MPPSLAVGEKLLTFRQPDQRRRVKHILLDLGKYLSPLSNEWLIGSIIHVSAAKVSVN